LLLERLHLSIPGSARRTQDVAENLGVSMGGLENLPRQAYLSTELKWKQPTLFYLTWSALNAKPKNPHLQYLIMNAQGVSTNTTTRKCRICRIYGYHLTLRFWAGASTPSTLADLKLEGKGPQIHNLPITLNKLWLSSKIRDSMVFANLWLKELDRW
jgi:hypothetical protein